MKTLVRPELGCAAPIWDPCLGLQISQMGRVRGGGGGAAAR